MKTGIIYDLTYNKMSHSYSCTESSCSDLYLDHLGEVIEHLRGIHGHSFMIRRPFALGMPDSHGNIWYCFGCEGKLGKDHRSFGSDKAMWNHLSALHDSCVDYIMRDL